MWHRKKADPGINGATHMTGQMHTPNVWKYLRVSTDEQDTQNQALCVADWCRKIERADFHEVCEEASTKRNWREREIRTVLDQCGPGDQIIVSEISRLARNTLECLEIFKEAADRGTTIVAVKNGLTMDGSMASKIVSIVIAMAAEIERDMIRARTTEALARRRKMGLPLGRPEGATSASKIDSKREQVATLMNANVSKSAIARLLNVSRGTLDRALTKWEQPQ